MQNQPTVFVIDQDKDDRSAVGQVVGQMGLRLVEYESGWDFLDSDSPFESGCVLMEVRIADIGGLQIQKRLNQLGSVLPVVFLTAHATTATAVSAMRAGALQFLEKPIREHDLWESVQEAVAWNQERRREQAAQQEQQDRMSQLTPKERPVLEGVVGGKPNRAIAEELGVCVRTIELRRASLMNKLGVGSLTELMQLVGTNGAAEPLAVGGNGRNNGGNGHPVHRRPHLKNSGSVDHGNGHVRPR